MPFNLGVTELVLIMVVLLLVFGARRLPEIGSSMGKGIREFKRSIKEVQESIDDDAAPPARRLDAPGEPPGGGEPKKLSE